ncbi:MAG: VPLPA-CTERM sorting domain-containing protein [Chloroflexota bacterium]|nr:VPLPA-CTERM sorting domain-containing protein [Chloroflexota bacterium]
MLGSVLWFAGASQPARASTAAMPKTLASSVPGSAIVRLMRHGRDACRANSLGPNDDGSSPAVTLPFTANFFGVTYNSLYVNNNGNVSFDMPLSDYTPYPLASTQHVMIAPFFADVDTRAASSGVTTYGSGIYQGHATFCVDWVNVGYFALHTDKLNSFQLLLVNRADRHRGDFDIIMNYGQVQWETGDASGGSDGLGGTPARAGYTNGGTAVYEFPHSGVNGAFLDSNPNGLRAHSFHSSQKGRYIFFVRNINVGVPGRRSLAPVASHTKP